MFKNAAAEFIFTRTYSRWVDDLNRRETWPEAVTRLMNFYKESVGEKVPKSVMQLLEKQILVFGVMPSMRLMWAAGDAARRENASAYNCSFLPIEDIKGFSEVLYILMCGTGVGFSCEEKFISKLPAIKHMTSDGVGVYVVEDSKEGWARAFLRGLECWFDGIDIEFDYSLIRPRGARLKTMGGRASGPDPLIKLMVYAREVIMGAQGRHLTDIEVHDLVCEIAEIVVVGGVRRSSLVSFSDVTSSAMRDAKNWPMPPRRYMANNSVVFETKPDAVTFLKEWTALAASGTGERGIYNVSNLQRYSPRRKIKDQIIRSNPCGEILLRPYQFCNLSEIVVRAEDTFDTLVEKVKAAVWIGAIQSTYTKFNFLREEFKINCEEERLMGVSLTGQLDNIDLMTDQKLQILRDYAIKTAKKASNALGINLSVSITTGKPSGTVSQLVDASSGCHPRYNDFYIRRYRISGTDPLFKMMRDQGFNFTPENGQAEKDFKPHFEGDTWSEDKVQTWVVSFPIKAPENSITRHCMSAIDQLEHYRKIQNNWCEHNQSITVYVDEDEWIEVGNYVFKHFDEIIGVSFLPKDSGHYEQAPYEDITEAEYLEMMKNFPQIDYSHLSRFEMEDGTTGASSLACTGDKCELV